jgi:hypothetical protein
VGLIAFSVLFVLGVVAGSLQFVLGSTHKQFYHAYYNEKALALIEGVNSIARGVAQSKLADLLKGPDKWQDLTEDVTGTAVKLRLWEEGDRFTPTVKVEARVKSDPLVIFAKSGGAYKTIRESIGNEGLFKEGNEIAGKVEIRTSVQFDIKGPSNFSVPKRTVTAEYEFKRILRTPQFFRQFVLWVKDASTSSDELEKVQEHSGYNQVENDQKGDASEGAVFLSPGGDASMPLKASNPFKTTVGYVYLGGNKPIFLNLSAGNDSSNYSEAFHMYKGKSSPFYPMWRSDFTGFLSKAKLQPDGAGGGGESGGGSLWDKIKRTVKKGVKWVKEKLAKLFTSLSDFTKVMDQLQDMETGGRKSTGLYAYYLTRKDYGYAKTWAGLTQFGFGPGAVTSSTLHLYGVKEPQDLGSNGVQGNSNLAYDGGTWGPTLVMGKVYRRNLSLAGYKQTRATDNPSGGQTFEVQAGPIEYFKDLDALLKRSADPTKSDDTRPFWVWDGRMDWTRHKEAVNGTYIPISGYGFLGRILPQLPAFMEEYESDMVKIWKHSLMPPKELREELADGDLKKLAEFHKKARDLSDFPRDAKGGISPILLLLWKKGFFKSYRGSGPWIDTKGSPFFEELIRNFAYASFLNKEELEKLGTDIKNYQGTPDPKSDYSDDDIRAALMEGHRLWQDLRDFAERSKLPILDPSQFPNGMGKFWSGSVDEDKYKGIFPFSLPDPWSQTSPGGGSGSTASGGTAGGAPSGNVKEHPFNFQKYFDKEFGSKKQEIYDKYVRPIMTDPGRTMPYNYSMRFVYEEIKALFHVPDPGARAKALADVAPEVRDGIGFEVEENKDYLSLEDTGTGEGVKFRRALDDEVLEKIYAKRSSSETLKQGYFFMDEYGSGSTKPSDASIDELYGTGSDRRYCWVGLTEKEFRDRFGPVGTDTGQIREISFGNAAEVSGDFSIFSEGPTMVFGGGVLKVSGTLKISHAIGSDKPLTILADRIEIGGDTNDVVKAMLITKDLQITGPMIIQGAVIAEKWNLSEGAKPGGMVLIGYDSKLKTEESFVQVIEPRISKITISGGEK